ncbi:LysE family translocator [bacterium]|nr:LysE family translocator [bacterium]
MNTEVLFAFFLGMLVLAATPGPGVFASVSRAVSEGFRSALIFIGGLVTGDILFFCLALLGLSAISLLMGRLFFIIRITGGAYLVFLGIQMIRRRGEEFRNGVKSSGRHKSYISGLLVTLGNPKPILFYASVVPTIIDIHEINGVEVLAIAFIITAVSFIVIGVYCALAVLSKSVFIQKRHYGRINTVSGLVLITVGSAILLKKH